MTANLSSTAQDCTASTQPSKLPTAKHAVGGKSEVLIAQNLLAGRPWVGIEYNGQHYRLQTTRAGKLILTK